jgi:hypothetical protein
VVVKKFGFVLNLFFEYTELKEEEKQELLNICGKLFDLNNITITYPEFIGMKGQEVLTEIENVQVDKRFITIHFKLE